MDTSRGIKRYYKNKQKTPKKCVIPYELQLKAIEMREQGERMPMIANKLKIPLSKIVKFIDKKELVMRKLQVERNKAAKQQRLNKAQNPQLREALKADVAQSQHGQERLSDSSNEENIPQPHHANQLELPEMSPVCPRKQVAKETVKEPSIYENDKTDCFHKTPKSNCPLCNPNVNVYGEKPGTKRVINSLQKELIVQVKPFDRNRRLRKKGFVDEPDYFPDDSLPEIKNLGNDLNKPKRELHFPDIPSTVWRPGQTIAEVNDNDITKDHDSDEYIYDEEDEIDENKDYIEGIKDELEEEANEAAKAAEKEAKKFADLEELAEEEREKNKEVLDEEAREGDEDYLEISDIWDEEQFYKKPIKRKPKNLEEEEVFVDVQSEYESNPEEEKEICEVKKILKKKPNKLPKRSKKNNYLNLLPRRLRGDQNIGPIRQKPGMCNSQMNKPYDQAQSTCPPILRQKPYCPNSLDLRGSPRASCKFKKSKCYDEEDHDIKQIPTSSLPNLNSTDELGRKKLLIQLFGEMSSSSSSSDDAAESLDELCGEIKESDYCRESFKPSDNSLIKPDKCPNKSSNKESNSIKTCMLSQSAQEIICNEFNIYKNEELLKSLSSGLSSSQNIGKTCPFSEEKPTSICNNVPTSNEILKQEATEIPEELEEPEISEVPEKPTLEISKESEIPGIRKIHNICHNKPTSQSIQRNPRKRDTRRSRSASPKAKRCKLSSLKNENERKLKIPRRKCPPCPCDQEKQKPFMYSNRDLASEPCSLNSSFTKSEDVNVCEVNSLAPSDQGTVDDNLIEEKCQEMPQTIEEKPQETCDIPTTDNNEVVEVVKPKKVRPRKVVASNGNDCKPKEKPKRVRKCPVKYDEPKVKPKRAKKCPENDSESKEKPKRGKKCAENNSEPKEKPKRGKKCAENDSEPKEKPKRGKKYLENDSEPKEPNNVKICPKNECETFDLAPFDEGTVDDNVIKENCQAMPQIIEEKLQKTCDIPTTDNNEVVEVVKPKKGKPRKVVTPDGNDCKPKEKPKKARKCPENDGESKVKPKRAKKCTENDDKPKTKRGRKSPNKPNNE